jgi:hypothetical protein
MSHYKISPRNSGHKTNTGTVVFINEISPYPDCFQRPYREPLSINTLLQKLYVGYSGWSYEGWLGHFYP